VTKIKEALKKFFSFLWFIITLLFTDITENCGWVYYPDYCKYTHERIIGTKCYCRRHRFIRWSYMTWKRNWIIWTTYKIKPLATFPHPVFQKLGWM